MKRLFSIVLILMLLLSGCGQPPAKEIAAADEPVEKQEQTVPFDQPEILPQQPPEESAPAEETETLPETEPTTLVPMDIGAATVCFFRDEEPPVKTYSLYFNESEPIAEILFGLTYDPDQVCKCESNDLSINVKGHTFYISYTEKYARTANGQASLSDEEISVIRKGVQAVRGRYLQGSYPVIRKGIFSEEYSDLFVVTWRCSTGSKVEPALTAADFPFLENPGVTYELGDPNAHCVTATYTDLAALEADHEAMKAMGKWTLHYTAYRTREGEPLPDLTRDPNNSVYIPSFIQPITAGTLKVQVNTPCARIFSLDLFSKYPVVAMEADCTRSPVVTLYLSVYEKSEMAELCLAIDRTSYLFIAQS